MHMMVLAIQIDKENNHLSITLNKK